MHYTEWLLLVGGIMEDTPLGQVVLIRKENDHNRLKNFTKYEPTIRREWQDFRAGKVKKPAEDFAKHFEQMFAEMFG